MQSSVSLIQLTTSADNGAQSGEVQGDEFQAIASTQSQSEESEARKGVHSVEHGKRSGRVHGAVLGKPDTTTTSADNDAQSREIQGRIRPTQGVQGVDEHIVGPILNKPAVLLR